MNQILRMNFKVIDINNPVTEADLKVNETIIKNIKKNYSDIELGYS